MAASTIVQSLYDQYHNAATQFATSESGQILTAVHDAFVGALALAVLVIGYLMTTGQQPINVGLARFGRIAIVAAFMSAAHFNSWVVTPVTTTIPNAITQAVSSQGGPVGAAAFDTLIDAAWKMADQINAQLASWWFLGERLAVNLAAGIACIFVIITAAIWILAGVAADFIVVLGAFVIPFFLFDATREFTMRWVGKMISLFFVMALSIMLATFVVNTEMQLMSQYGSSMAATASASPGFTDYSGVAIGQPPEQDAATTQNIAAAMRAIWTVVVLYAFGAFLLTILTGLALYIGGSSGFSAAPALAAVYMIASRAGGAAARGIGKARA